MKPKIHQYAKGILSVHGHEGRSCLARTTAVTGHSGSHWLFLNQFTTPQNNSIKRIVDIGFKNCVNNEIHQ